MSSDRLFSPETSGLLLAMTALQQGVGVDPTQAYERAVAAWEEHVATHGNDLWEPEELRSLVSRLTQS